MTTVSSVGLVILAILVSASPSAYAASSRAEVKSFSEMQKYVEKINDPSSTLVVMDDDDTLTMMSCPDQNKPLTCQYLGGPAWFSWQQSQVKRMAQPRVADTDEELLTASFVLFALNKMAYTDADLPDVLDGLAGSGVRLMVETARGTDTVSATERQFSNLPTKNGRYDNLLMLISGHSLVFGPEGIASKPSPFHPCGDRTGRPVTYQQGALYLSGQNKGTILKCILDEYNALQGVRPVRHVVFVDDTEQNIAEVQKAFEKDGVYDVKALWYTALREHKNALTEGEMAETYQADSMKQWEAIKEALRKNLQNPMIR